MFRQDSKISSILKKHWKNMGINESCKKLLDEKVFQFNWWSLRKSCCKYYHSLDAIREVEDINSKIEEMNKEMIVTNNNTRDKNLINAKIQDIIEELVMRNIKFKICSDCSKLLLLEESNICDCSNNK